jgi:hypothetical protein
MVMAAFNPIRSRHPQALRKYGQAPCKALEQPERILPDLVQQRQKAEEVGVAEGETALRFSKRSCTKIGVA